MSAEPNTRLALSIWRASHLNGRLTWTAGSPCQTLLGIDVAARWHRRGDQNLSGFKAAVGSTNDKAAPFGLLGPDRRFRSEILKPSRSPRGKVDEGAAITSAEWVGAGLKRD
jgi:hypothetical protein